MKIFALLKKEARIAFASPVAYVSYTTFLLIVGYMFLNNTVYASQNAFSYGAGGGSIVDILFRPTTHQIAVILLFISPALSMRLFAEERRTGAIELLYTYPFGDLDLVLGKFFTALLLLLLLLSPTLLYPIFMKHFTAVEWPVIWTQYLGLLLLGCAFLSVGLWASQITDNQIVAAVLSLGLLLGFWLVGWVTQSLADIGWAKILGQVSILDHFNNFSKGVLNTSDLSYYLLFIGFFLYLTLKGLESRSWRGARE